MHQSQRDMTLGDDNEDAQSDVLPNFVTDSCISGRFDYGFEKSKESDAVLNERDSLFQVMRQMVQNGDKAEYERIVGIINNWKNVHSNNND